MSKTTVLVAFGSNNIRIPCMFFDNLEEGLEKCEDLFKKKGVPVKETNDNPFTNFNSGLEKIKDDSKVDGFIFDPEYGKKIITNEWREHKRLIEKEKLNDLKKNDLILDIEYYKDVELEINSYERESGSEWHELQWKINEEHSFSIFHFNPEEQNKEDYIAVKYKEKITVYEEEVMGRQAFKSYYDGCGGIYRYYLTEVENNKVFLPFSLD